MKFHVFRVAAFTLAGLSVIPAAVQAELITIYSEVENPTDGSVVQQSRSYSSYDSLKDLLNDVDNVATSDFNITYDAYNEFDKSPLITLPRALVRSEYLGTVISLTAAQDDPAIRVHAPGINVDETFRGNTRQESLTLFSNWSRDNASDLVKRANTLVAGNPVSGNPASAVTIGVGQDFNINPDSVIGDPTKIDTVMEAVDSGSTATSSDTKSAAVSESSKSKFSVAARFSNYTIAGKDASVVSLPLGYAYAFDNGYSLLVSVPLTYMTYDNTTSYSSSLGVGVKVPMSRLLGGTHIMGMTSAWALTPVLRVGAVGSPENQASISAIYSGTLLSELDIKVSDSALLGFKNMFSYYVTTSVTQYTDIEIDNVKIRTPNIENAIFRNGVYYSSYLWNTKLYGRKLSATAFFIDTQFTGDNLFINSQEEIGFSLALSPRPGSESSSASFLRRKLDAQDFRLGFTYTVGKNVEGFSVNVGMAF